LGWLKKLVDELRKGLHNLVSLLLTQQRKTAVQLTAGARRDL
jgi:hypothetical protein